jgi:hypothetical protein
VIKTQVVEHLPIKSKTLSKNPKIAKREKLFFKEFVFYGRVKQNDY